MSDPTTYWPFDPSSGLYMMLPHAGRSYSTIITPGPTRRTQRRAVLARGLRFWEKLIVRCIDPATNQSDPDVFTTARNFEATLLGRYLAFWIFDPVPQQFNVTITLDVVSGVATNLPVLLPFIGGSFSLLGTSITDFDQNGPGGEWQLISYDVSAQPDGPFEVILHGNEPANVRYAVRKTHDSDDWGFDPDWAVPPAEITLSIEEDRG